MPDITVQVLTAHTGARGPRQRNLDASTVLDALRQVDSGAAPVLRAKGTALALGVVVYRNGHDVRHLGGIQAELTPADHLLIVIPATDS
jgi:hypothetical protein